MSVNGSTPTTGILVFSISLIGGNPANLIKKRFTEEQIDKLLEIK